jgi:hypothetical protein
VILIVSDAAPLLAAIGATSLAGFGKPTPLAAQTLDQAPSVLVFDVAETLLDLQMLRPLFQRLFGNGAMVDEWFGETILYSETATLTNTFVPFGPLGVGVLRMLGRIYDVPTMRLWFQDLIIYSQALTIADVYVPFTDISGAVLDMIAASRGVKIAAADRTELTDRFATSRPTPRFPERCGG